MTHTVSETLNLAADLIEKRGWSRGCGGWEDGRGGGLCLEGGIMAAQGLRIGDVILSEFFHACPVALAVADYLALPGDEDLWAWNDDQKDAAQVIEVLRAAAVVEAARESARESVTA